MGDSIAELLGYDPDSPEVRAGHRHGAFIANLIDGLVGWRHKLGLTQDQVAARMDTTQSRVSDLERITGDPRISSILRYADAVGVELTFHVSDPDPIHVATRSISSREAGPGRSEAHGVSFHVYYGARR